MSGKFNVLITGENGYIGTKICEYLQKCGNFNIDIISLMDDDWKKQDFSKFDSIVHLAAIVHKPKTSKEIYEKVNHTLTREVAEKAKKDKIKQFIFFSTASVYGNTRGKITRETPTVPNNYYGESKLKAEQALRKMENETFKLAIIRPPMVYGKGCKGNYVSLSKLAKKTPVFPKVDNQRSMIYIENLCEFVKLLIQNQEAGIFFPQDSEFVNTSKMVEYIAKENNHKIWFSKFFNVFVGIGKKSPGKIGIIFNKVFGDLYYDLNMSEYKENYRITNFQEAIHNIER